METTVAGETEVRAGRREWIGLAVLALPTLLLSVDISVLYLALPHLSADLRANSTEQLWVIDIYSFMTAGFLVTMGNLGDRIGRRKLLLIGAAFFGLSSVVAAESSSALMLIIARTVMGISAATLMPSSLALIRNMFKNQQQMGQAVAIWFSCFMVGMALGPVVGGVVLNTFWWGAAFLLAVPVMLLLLVTGPFLLPEYRNPNAGKLDLLDVVLSLAAVLPVIYGLKELARSGWHPGSLVSIVLGLACGSVFVWRQQRIAEPLLDLQLFRSRIFSTSLGTLLLVGVTMAAISLLSAIYLQVVKGLSPLTAGFWLLPQNIVMVIGSMTAPALAKKMRLAYVMAVGLLVTAFGLVVMTQVSSADGPYVLVIGLTLASGGVSLAMTQTSSLILGSAPPEKAGAAAGVMETSGEFGVALGIATLGSLGTFIYRVELPGHLPAGLSADTVQTARGSLNAAVTAAQGLPGPLGAGLVQGARVAFTEGLNVVAGVSAVIVLILSVLALAILRDSKPSAPSAPAVPPAVEEAVAVAPVVADPGSSDR